MAVIINNGKGTIKIPNAIIGEIAYRAALDCEGVAEITSGSSKTKRGEGGVKIGVKDGGIEIKLGIVMRYGASAEDTAAALNSLIKERVLEFTGVENLKIDVNIESISV